MKRFQRHIEDFHCSNCGAEVSGDGYTNHCPECLWSKHVDVNPGDRLNPCQGMLKPISLIVKSDQRWIVHRCQKCNETMKIKVREEDNFDRQLDLLRTGIK